MTSINDDHELFARANKEHDAGNNKKAFKLLMQAAAEGDAYAPNSIGYFYDHGIGVAKNKKKAFSWYRRGARAGDVIAYTNIGILYSERGNFIRARFWFLKALRKGDESAALKLAKLCLQTKINLKKAHLYLGIAVRSKNVNQDTRDEAARLLKQLQGKADGMKAT